MWGVVLTFRPGGAGRVATTPERFLGNFSKLWFHSGLFAHFVSCYSVYRLMSCYRDDLFIVSINRVFLAFT